MSLPCRRCGGDKAPGPGRRYCDPCREIRASQYEIDQRERLTHPHKPCARCGGPKVPEGQKAKRGQKVCAPCKELNEADTRARRRSEQQKDRKRDGPSVRKTPKAIPAKPVKISMAKSKTPKVPKDIESAWGRAGTGSQFRRLCPTRADLVKRYGVMA